MVLTLFISKFYLELEKLESGSLDSFHGTVCERSQNQYVLGRKPFQIEGRDRMGFQEVGSMK